MLRSDAKPLSTRAIFARLEVMRRKRLIVVLVICLSLLALTPFALRLYTDWRYRQHIYRVDEVPARRVAIVFGAQVFPRGRLSPMLRDRVATGAALYHAGKVDLLLLTGDGENEIYSEPDAMARYARQLGVPDEAIVLDPGGFRTYDSCYRARDVFAVNSAILVTQEFHLDRALLLCNTLGVDAVGVAADYQTLRGYGERHTRASQLREIPATTLAFLDLIRRPVPAANLHD